MRILIISVIYFTMCLAVFGDIFGNNTYIDSDIPVKIRDSVEDVSTNYTSSFILLGNNELWVTGDRICGGDKLDSYTKFASNVGAIGDQFYITKKGELFRLNGDLYLVPYEKGKENCPRKLQTNVLWYDGWSLVVKSDNSLWDYYDPKTDAVNQNLTANHLSKIMDNVQKAWRTFCYDCSKNYKGSNTSLALIKTDNNLYVQGQNINGQLGVGNKKEVKDLVKVMDDVKLITISSHLTFVLKNDKTLWVAGENLTNFGNGSKADTSSFIKIADDVIDVQMGETHEKYGSQTFILKSDGSLWFSGINLFDNYTGVTVPLIRDLPKENLQFVKILSDVKKFSFNYDHLLIIKNDNSLWGLGKNIN